MPRHSSSNVSFGHRLGLQQNVLQSSACRYVCACSLGVTLGAGAAPARARSRGSSLITASVCCVVA